MNQSEHRDLPNTSYFRITPEKEKGRKVKALCLFLLNIFLWGGFSSRNFRTNEAFFVFYLILSFFRQHYLKSAKRE